MTNTDKAVAKLNNLPVIVVEATVVRRTSPAQVGVRQRKRAARCGLGDVTRPFSKEEYRAHSTKGPHRVPEVEGTRQRVRWDPRRRP